ncbi:hypothetical protein [Helicobacter pylori]|uniref:hypothetical protein n=1 Tax=Helicobacter pylori TaxID=210 RepID=UPI000FDCEAC6|nr:hypothetical protein [Helicobacter pylori]RVY60182.1 hypothetical protein ECC34_04875 [Helicobacter pylori]RVZ75790.1 hypothetical protein EC586_04060 [Helicobacter pylori]
MMRLVAFKTNGLLKAFNKHNELIYQKEIHEQNTTQKLEFTISNHYEFNGVKFGVCKGESVLEMQDYPKNLNFSRLNIRSLNDYLLFGKEPQDKEQKELVKEFLKIYDKNIEKGFYYLEPPFFKEKESELLKMRFETNVRS